MAKRLLSGDNTTVLAISPQKPDIRVPTEAGLRAAISDADKTTVTAWSDAATTGVWMADKPTPATVESRREIPEIGVTIVRFSNGVEAWLKPTDFKNDQVVFDLETRRRRRRWRLPADYVEATLADTYVERSGMGGIKAADLSKMLAGKVASASPFISLSTHGVSGSAAPADLETALQLLHEEITAPGDDPEAFAVMQRQLNASIANRDQAPGRVFGERLALLNACDHYTRSRLTEARIASLDRQKMMSFYRERFANAADFTFFMVGRLQARHRSANAGPVRRLAPVDRPERVDLQERRALLPRLGQARAR